MMHRGADRIEALQKPVPRAGMGFFIMGTAPNRLFDITLDGRAWREE
jgi:hypothetical protein